MYCILHHIKTQCLLVCLTLQECDSLAQMAEPHVSLYQGHNAFREKYFSGQNKRGAKEDNKPQVNGEEANDS